MEAPENREKWLARRTIELGHVQDFLPKLQASQEQLLAKSRRLDQELAAMRSSLSWRITAPLRVLRRLILGTKEAESALLLPWPGIPDAPKFPPVPAPLIRHPRRIGVDVSSLCGSDAGGGVQRVVREIARRLAETSDANDIVLLDFRRGWPTDATFRFFKNPETEARAELPCFEFRTLLMLDASWRFLDLTRPILQEARSAGIEVVSCIYDLIPLDFPETCQPENKEAYLRWLPEAIRLSDSFVCISKAVADRFARHLTDEKIQEPKRIGWWNLGCDFGPAKAEPVARLMAEKYVLMVGTLEPRKRHHLALDAFELGWKDGRLNAALVIAGRHGWGTESLLQRIQAHPEWQKRLFWFPNLTDQELAGLYSHASALLQASCAEGFGLPIVESAKFGKPVALSDLPVFREIVKSDGYFFKPENAADLVRALLHALSTDAAPTAVVQTTWTESAAALKNLIQSGAYPFSHP